MGQGRTASTHKIQPELPTVGGSAPAAGRQPLVGRAQQQWCTGQVLGTHGAKQSNQVESGAGGLPHAVPPLPARCPRYSVRRLHVPSSEVGSAFGLSFRAQSHVQPRSVPTCGHLQCGSFGCLGHSQVFLVVPVLVFCSHLPDLAEEGHCCFTCNYVLPHVDLLLLSLSTETHRGDGGTLFTEGVLEPAARSAVSHGFGKVFPSLQVLAEPVGNLFFAGEHTNKEDYASAHGAFISGEKAAESIHRYLQARQEQPQAQPAQDVPQLR